MIDRILSYSLSAQWRLWSDWASAHCRLICIFAGLTCQFVGFCQDAAQIMAELFLEISGKKFMSASVWVQVLDFTKSLVYSNCQNDRKCFFFFFFFFFRWCAMYAFYHLYVCMFVYHFGRIWCFALIICKKGSSGNTASKPWKQQTRSIHAR